MANITATAAFVIQICAAGRAGIGMLFVHISSLRQKHGGFFILAGKPQRADLDRFGADRTQVITSSATYLKYSEGKYLWATIAILINAAIKPAQTNGQ